ncbi:hypothetical protein HRED_02146, partial [Candidatus Haloredivivus sp. G17]
EKNGDEEALQKLIEYNQYDAKNLQDVTEIIVERLEREVYRPHIK